MLGKQGDGLSLQDAGIFLRLTAKRARVLMKYWNTLKNNVWGADAFSADRSKAKNIIKSILGKDLLNKNHNHQFAGGYDF